MILAAAAKKVRKPMSVCLVPLRIKLQHPAARSVAGRGVFGMCMMWYEPLLVDLPLLETLEFLAGGAHDGVGGAYVGIALFAGQIIVSPPESN